MSSRIIKGVNYVDVWAVSCAPANLQHQHAEGELKTLCGMDVAGPSDSGPGCSACGVIIPLPERPPRCGFIQFIPEERYTERCFSDSEENSDFCNEHGFQADLVVTITYAEACALVSEYTTGAVEDLRHSAREKIMRLLE